MHMRLPQSQARSLHRRKYFSRLPQILQLFTKQFSSWWCPYSTPYPPERQTSVIICQESGKRWQVVLKNKICLQQSTTQGYGYKRTLSFSYISSNIELRGICNFQTIRETHFCHILYWKQQWTLSHVEKKNTYIRLGSVILEWLIQMHILP